MHPHPSSLHLGPFFVIFVIIFLYDVVCEMSRNRIVFFFVVKVLQHKNYYNFQFNTGDMVRVLDDADVVKLLQGGHGGWIDAMSTVCLGLFFEQLY